MDVPNLKAWEQRLLYSVWEAFDSSLDLAEVLARAREPLSRLLPSDYVAMCVSKLGQPADYDWLVADMPAPYFANYSEMAGGDFVRSTVVRRPNHVFRDTEMVPREVLERSALYQRGRELGMPMEHVMAVMLDVGQDWHGGLTLYRERRRPFSDHTRDILQWLTPRLVSTVRNCRRFAEEAGSRRLLETLGELRGESLLVLASPTLEVKRTGRATELLKAWFRDSERGPGGLPSVWVEKLSELSRTQGGMGLIPEGWVREDPARGCKLKVSFIRLPVEGRLLWVVSLEEVSMDLLSTWRRKLTPRELEIANSVLQGSQNDDIAKDLKCALGTVKKHLTRIYKKLGVDNRADFISRALRP